MDASSGTLNEAFSLAGKVAIVTGSGRGIGAGIARKLAEAGAAVAVTARTEAEIEATAGAIVAAGGRAIPIRVDIADTAQLPGLVDRVVEEFGGLDIVVNNAGGATSPKFVDTRVETLEDHFHLIVSVSFELVRIALPHLLERPGASVINTLSPGAHRYPRGNLAYYTAKSALTHMTRLMAADLGPKVRVNGIIPGPIRTPSLEKLMASRPEIAAAAARSVRVRRIGEPDDIGYGCVYLASRAGSFVTGAILPINGGEVEELREVSPDL